MILFVLSFWGLRGQVEHFLKIIYMATGTLPKLILTKRLCKMKRAILNSQLPSVENVFHWVKGFQHIDLCKTKRLNSQLALGNQGPLSRALVSQWKTFSTGRRASETKISGFWLPTKIKKSRFRRPFSQWKTFSTGRRGP